MLIGSKLGSKPDPLSHALGRIREGFGVISNSKLGAGRDNSISSFPGGLTLYLSLGRTIDIMLTCRLEQVLNYIKG